MFVADVFTLAVPTVLERIVVLALFDERGFLYVSFEVLVGVAADVAFVYLPVPLQFVGLFIVNSFCPPYVLGRGTWLAERFVLVQAGLAPEEIWARSCYF